MLQQATRIDELYSNFEWNIPEHYNIGFDVCEKWLDVDPDRVAIIDVNEQGEAEKYSFSQLSTLSNQLANALAELGAVADKNGIGDRIGVLLPQCAQTAISHIAVAKMGCVSIPLFTLFGEDALLHRLRDSGAKVVITNSEGSAKLVNIRDQLPELTAVLSIDGADELATCFHAAITKHTGTFQIVRTRADEPALLIYTSGTTGNPKGALHAHRVLLGHLPGVELSHDFLPHPDDCIWTPADWAWIGGLLDVLMPALHHGIPVVASRFRKFSPESAVELIKKHQVRNVFLPPTALKIMKLMPDAKASALGLRSVSSGGETLGAELLAWGKDVLGTTINEFYGQTECNMVISSCAALEKSPPGAMGRSVPGHTVAIIDPATGEVLPADTVGAIAIQAPDPVMFLGYWNNPAATQEKFINGPTGQWLLTGDQGTCDQGGHFYFLGRNDDVINSAGYRIGPAEIEDCLIGHKAVHMAGVIGTPDSIRGSVVTAYVTLKDGYAPSDALASDISQHVKTRLAAHEYPRIVRFISHMPMTTTGKIIRHQLRRMALEKAQG